MKKKVVKKKKKVVLNQTDLFLHLVNRIEKLEEAVKPKKVTKGPYNHMRPWDEDQERALKFLFEQNASLPYLSTRMGRTQFSIFMRLVKMGLLNEGNVYHLMHTSRP